MKLTFALAACLIACPACAEIVRCDLPDGRVEYRESPCAAGHTRAVKAADAPASDEGPAFPPRSGNEEPEIVGDAKFQQRVSEALSLLKRQDARTYAVVAGYVGRIRQAAHSGMAATDDPPTFLMSDATAMYSVTWAAASIAHDAYHSKLYFDYQGAHPERHVPDNVWTGTVAEAKCTKFQIASMRRIGAAPHEIDNAAAYYDGHHIAQELSTRKY